MEQDPSNDSTTKNHHSESDSDEKIKAAEFEEKLKAEADAQEKLNQRREARKRKILDNAKTRLEKLGGRNINFTTDDDHRYYEYSDPEVEPNEIPISFNNRIGGTSTINRETQDPFVSTAPAKELTIMKYRIHVLLSMTLTYLLMLLGMMGDTSYSVFIPTGICVVLELIFKKPRPMPPIMALTAGLTGLPTKQTDACWKVICTMQDVVIDLGLSVFVLVILSLVFNPINGNNLITVT